ncbi:hypothetical protein KJ780_04260, partial [Candidatus Micrarchaeota archaeon]|nr:hypothetical protein [Candidatus Micrarchaeota archaeon]
MRDLKKRFYSELINLLRTADVAIEVVDARFPEKTRVDKLETRFNNKLIIAAAKTDLIPKEKHNKLYHYISVRTR